MFSQALKTSNERLVDEGKFYLQETVCLLLSAESRGLAQRVSRPVHSSGELFFAHSFNKKDNGGLLMLLISQCV